MSKILTVKQVETIFSACLYKKEEDVGEPFVVDGIMAKVSFNRERVEAYKMEIAEMLLELPAVFHKSTGGGMSFLSACVDRHGEQWTGEHVVVGKLFDLGLATGNVEYCLPRHAWGMLPGGVPYYVIDVL